MSRFTRVIRIIRGMFSTEFPAPVTTGAITRAELTSYAQCWQH